ncbi:MAG: hypothetical protein ACE5GB_03375 [Acidimicrobiales bacterium]
MRRTAIVLTALAVLASACGDDGSSLEDVLSSGDDAVSSDSGADVGPGPGASTDFCRISDQINDRLDSVDTEIAAAIASGDLEAVAGYFDDSFGLMQQAAAVAPGEIRDDVEVLVTGFRGMIDVLEEFDFDFTAIPSDDPRISALDDPRFDEASDRLDAFCGIDSDEDEETDGGTGLPGPQSDAVRGAMVQALADSLGIDETLAGCLVDELGLDDPASIDPSVFGDLTQEVCGTTMGEIFGG